MPGDYTVPKINPYVTAGFQVAKIAGVDPVGSLHKSFSSQAHKRQEMITPEIKIPDSLAGRVIYMPKIPKMSFTIGGPILNAYDAQVKKERNFTIKNINKLFGEGNPLTASIMKAWGQTGLDNGFKRAKRITDTLNAMEIAENFYRETVASNPELSMFGEEFDRQISIREHELARNPERYTNYGLAGYEPPANALRTEILEARADDLKSLYDEFAEELSIRDPEWSMLEGGDRMVRNLYEDVFGFSQGNSRLHGNNHAYNAVVSAARSGASGGDERDALLQLAEWKTGIGEIKREIEAASVWDQLPTFQEGTFDFGDLSSQLGLTSDTAPTQAEGPPSNDPLPDPIDDPIDNIPSGDSDSNPMFDPIDDIINPGPDPIGNPPFTEPPDPSFELPGSGDTGNAPAGTIPGDVLDGIGAGIGIGAGAGLGGTGDTGVGTGIDTGIGADIGVGGFDPIGDIVNPGADPIGGQGGAGNEITDDLLADIDSGTGGPDSGINGVGVDAGLGAGVGGGGGGGGGSGNANPPNNRRSNLARMAALAATRMFLRFPQGSPEFEQNSFAGRIPDIFGLDKKRDLIIPSGFISKQATSRSRAINPRTLEGII